MHPLLRRAIWVALIVGGVIFAIQGGEYSTRDLFRQHERQRQITARIDSLKYEVDSLRSILRLLETDSATQERIARENWGMVRGNTELVYRFVEDTSRKDSARK
jgi:cell division protein FtsB